MGKLYRAGSLRGPARLNPRSRAHGELEPGRVRNSGGRTLGKADAAGERPSQQRANTFGAYIRSRAQARTRMWPGRPEEGD
jgi:hypothetical protein